MEVVGWPWSPWLNHRKSIEAFTRHSCHGLTHRGIPDRPLGLPQQELSCQPRNAERPTALIMLVTGPSGYQILRNSTQNRICNGTVPSGGMLSLRSRPWFSTGIPVRGRDNDCPATSDTRPLARLHVRSARQLGISAYVPSVGLSPPSEPEEIRRSLQSAAAAYGPQA
ncbi:hypothetical protein CONLIGDRAFT_317280 [Coniochaeta ligniaria NRRL 30616]|uniref:Uncharacterized protein n=1 Tax=Coniochaeta ligniaria NRRL 30616 TaxID=1408157 RepID=A0A1J7IUP5_9PEZI|nr:hypothetical protein CONLIGDRAFT_317280 [Coniochaeta ligniaria NRRL 30616]